ncbi:MAG: hypothetical protein IJS39_06730 [Synergistaceae bacterium]|nr:hypothetical protein [Synergistaceae bacterium]
MTAREIMNMWCDVCNKVYQLAEAAEEALSDEKFDEDLQLMVKQASCLIAVIEN